MLRRTNSFEDRYNYLMNELRNEILSGSIQPGEFILPENTLSEKYGLSRVSVRKVLAQLVEDGLIEKIAGKGNRVKLPEHEARRETLTLAWFSTSYEIDIIRQIIDKYEKENPYVKVDLLALPEPDYVNNLLNLIRLGSGPDLFILSDLHIREMIESNLLGTLDPYVPAHLDVERDSYAKVFDMFTVDGQVVATPFVFSPVVICYNELLFDKAGLPEKAQLHDWADLISAAEKCTLEPDGAGVVGRYGFCFSGSMNRWPVFLLQNDGRFIDEQGHSVFGDPRNAEALQYCVDLMYKHKVSPIYSHGSNYLAESLFKKERVAMILTTYYFMNEFRNHTFSWNVMPLPSHHTEGTLLLGGGLAINRQTAIPQVARRFIDFMVSKPAQTLLKRHGCTIPMLREVAEDSSLLDENIHPENYNVFRDVLPHARTLRELGLEQAQILLLQKELHLLWANMESPEQACTRIEPLLGEV